MDRFGSDFGAFDEQSGAEDDAANDGGADDGAHSNPPPSPVGQDERRMQVRAYNHWSALLGRESLPHIEDLEPECLGDFGPFSVLLDFSTGSETPTIQFIGAQLQKECSEFDLIETLPEIPQGSLLSKIAENYLRVVTEQGPVSFEAESQNAKGKAVAYRGILLPYSSDYDTIDFVYAVINWKEVADATTADALIEEIDRAMDYGLTEIEPEAEAAPQMTADILHFGSLASAEVDDGATEDVTAEYDESDPWERDDNILEMRDPALEGGDEFDDLPLPNFGASDEDVFEDEAEMNSGDTENTSEGLGLSPYAPEDEKVDEPMAYDTNDAAPESPKRSRQTDALGNPIGGAPAQDADDSAGGITSAADYGLPDWEEEEPEAEDVDDLVNPLADIDLNSRLLSLVNSGSRGKKTVDLATLSESQSDEEDEGESESESAGFDRKLFRPKAPSVDTLLSPEPYEEEDEVAASDEEVEFVEIGAEVSDEQVTDVPVESNDVHSEAVEAPKPEVEYAPLELPSAEVAVTEDVVGDVPAEYASDEVLIDEFVDDLTLEEVEEPEATLAEVEEEPLELHEEFLAADEDVDTLELQDEAEPETDDVLELAEIAEVAEVADDVTQDVIEDVVSQEADRGAATAGGGLTGLLAAVQELTEAARTTDDEERRALYEAVGRAFDVSIKAVMASGTQPADPVEELPVNSVASTGPDMALVMVRRHANGDTEVLGEVPHDSDLMENAQRRLASR